MVFVAAFWANSSCQYTWRDAMVKNPPANIAENNFIWDLSSGIYKKTIITRNRTLLAYYAKIFWTPKTWNPTTRSTTKIYRILKRKTCELVANFVSKFCSQNHFHITFWANIQKISRNWNVKFVRRHICNKPCKNIKFWSILKKWKNRVEKFITHGVENFSVL